MLLLLLAVRDAERGAIAIMDDEVMVFGENESPFLFSPTADRRGNSNKTYRPSAQDHLKNKNKSKNKRRRRSGSKKVQVPTTPPPPKPGTPLEVKRCAL